MLESRGVSVSKLLVPLTILAAIFASGLSILATRGRTLHPEGAELLWTFEFRLLLAFWVRLDRGVRSFSLPFEFDALVFFVWPVAIPYYLYRTRGRRGFLYAAAIFGLYLAPDLIASIVQVTRQVTS